MYNDGGGATRDSERELALCLVNEKKKLLKISASHVCDSITVY